MVNLFCSWISTHYDHGGACGNEQHYHSIYALASHWGLLGFGPVGDVWNGERHGAVASVSANELHFR